MYRMNEIVKMIRANGSARIVIDNETIRIGFADGGHGGVLTMLSGGYYTVRTWDGRRVEIAKGQLVEVI